ncbi:MAG: hypothetical protein WDM89_00545 [Rhizomicrobium sp.]
MRASGQTLAQLRATLSRATLDAPEKLARIPLGFVEADHALHGGLARGALHEVFAHPGHEASATGFAVGLAARVSNGRPVLWIRQDFAGLEFGELAATGLLELGSIRHDF